jgi:ABC-2 type transport system ATP-binding protein
MIEKLLIALTISRDTSVYLLDEPFGGVDVLARKKIMQSLLHWLPEDATVLVSTHYIQEIESLVDDALILKDGRLLAYQSVENIRQTEGLSLEQYYTQLYIEDNGGRE